MGRVKGIGGVFFKAEDPERLYAWYERHLGIKRDGDWGVAFRWRDDNPEAGMTVWSIFRKDSGYFDRPFMLNYRVENLDALLTSLAGEGVVIDPKREEDENGKFAWITDPEGNRIELWEPARPQGTGT